MHDYLPFVIIGLTSGAVYVIGALGLVLTYRTSGVFNFAHGAIGMVCAFLFYTLRQHMPTPLALLLAVLVVAPLVGLVVDSLFRRLVGAGAAATIVASLGLLVGLQGLVVLIYGADFRRMDAIFPTSTYRLFGLNVGVDQSVVVAVAIGASLALILFMRGTHLGLQTRAVVDNRPLAGLTATNSARVTRSAWMIGCSFAAMSGILFAPFVGLDSLLLTLLVVEAFGAAAVGRLRSFPVTVFAAFGLGVAQSVASKIVSESGSASLVGLPRSLPALLLFAAIIFSRSGSTQADVVSHRIGPLRRSQKTHFRFRPLPILGAGVIAIVLPLFLSGSGRLTLTNTVLFVLVFSSLSLLVGLSRQLSMAHGVFVALGATTLTHLRSAGFPYPVALLLAGLFLVPIGAALAIPAIRLSSLYLALATFGFGILAQTFVFPTSFGFGADGLVSIPRPDVLSGDLAFYYFALAVVMAGVVAVELVRVTRLGRVLVALADSPTGVGSLGINGVASRVVVFCLSAFLAGIAGGLLGTMVQVVNTVSFTFFQSLLWVTVLVVAGARSFGGVVLAAVLLVGVPGVLTSSVATEWQPVVFGAMAIFFAQRENGIMGLFHGVDFASVAKANRWRSGAERRQARYRDVLTADPTATAAQG